MRVEIGDRTYHVTFKNISEKVIHDPLPQVLADLVAAEKKTKRHDIRRYLRLRPRRVSNVTTICNIFDATSPETPIETGRAFYSNSEVTAGVPFDRVKAWRKALGRAISHLDFVLQREIRREFEAFLDKRQKQVAQSRLTASGDEEARSSSHTPTVVEQHSA